VAKNAKRGRNTGVVAQVLYLAIAILTGSPYLADAGGLASQVAAQAYMSTYTQDAEREADSLAIDTLIRAGYDPTAMVTMFQKLDADSEGGTRMPQFLSSHPAPADRIHAAQAEIAQRGGSQGLRRTDGGRLEIIQKRLELIIGTDVEEMMEEDEELEE
jgi:predicted Zn-dependent protease